MPAETLEFKLLDERGENLFEIINVVAKKAKIINGRIRSKKIDERAQREEEMYDPESTEQPTPQYSPEVKAVTIAMEELLEKGVNYRYHSPEEPSGFGEHLD